MKLDVVVVTHQTDAYLFNLLVSIRDRLPPEALATVHVLDNASSDRTTELLARFAADVPWLRTRRSERNLHHGPALDLLLRESCQGEWVLLLDSDTEILSDFASQLPTLTAPPPVFVGQIHPDPDQLYAYLCHLLVHRPSYLELPPFRQHGAPGLAFFAAVAERRLPYWRFRWCDHVRHYGQGTLRAVHGRGDLSNPFFAFAEKEISRRGASAERDAFEKNLGKALAGYLDGHPATPRVPFSPPAEPRRKIPRRRLARGPWTLRTARRLGLQQDDGEMRTLLRLVRRIRPHRVLEIGTAHGGSFFLWTSAAAPDATLVSVDLPLWELDDPGEETRKERLRSYARAGQRVHLVRRDSHDAAARREVTEVLGGERLDFLFVDGDDSHAGAARDLADYTPLVATGGLVAISGLDREGVRRAFTEVRTERAFEIREDGRGIGILPM